MPLMLALSALALAAVAQDAKPPTPTEIVEAAPAADWLSIAADDLLLIDLGGDRRVTIQLAPDFAPVHVANIRALARGNWWGGAAIYRVQDNYVVQWGNNDSERPFPAGVVEKPPAEYERPVGILSVRRLAHADPYAAAVGHAGGWPVAIHADGLASLVHCYASVGVARGLSPDTGTGGELYAVIGHAPRHLDRNIAIVGRVIDGFEHMTALPRGTGRLGFYEEEEEHVPIAGVRLASQLPEAEQPALQYLDTASDSFGAYVGARANRNDDFFIRPAGGVDLCNAPVPIRRAP